LPVGHVVRPKLKLHRLKPDGIRAVFADPLRPHKYNRLVRNHPNALLNGYRLICSHILKGIRAAARPDDLNACDLFGFAQPKR
jgi:hypothetical protein